MINPSYAICHLYSQYFAWGEAGC